MSINTANIDIPETMCRLESEMNQKELRTKPLGVYRLYWKDGGMSVASVGALYDGRRWFAPANWTSKWAEGIASTNWRLVEKMELIEEWQYDAGSGLSPA